MPFSNSFFALSQLDNPICSRLHCFKHQSIRIFLTPENREYFRNYLGAPGVNQPTIPNCPLLTPLLSLNLRSSPESLVISDSFTGKLGEPLTPKSTRNEIWTTPDQKLLPLGYFHCNSVPSLLVMRFAHSRSCYNR